MKLKAEWILFDFGGCLDSDGIHSRDLFLSEFRKMAPLNSLTSFQDAYTYSDQKVITESLIKDSNLLEMNQIMCSFIAKKLNLDESFPHQDVAINITTSQSSYLRRNSEILKKLVSKYHLGIISNFSGNLTKILEEFSLLHYFDFVLDSYHVGHSKPSPEIFNLALTKCQRPSENVFFIGDNPERDIAPAKSLGMKTILLSAQFHQSLSDHTISSFNELEDLFL